MVLTLVNLENPSTTPLPDSTLVVAAVEEQEEDFNNKDRDSVTAQEGQAKVWLGSAAWVAACARLENPVALLSIRPHL